jgi:signal transduction histidine kinase
VEGNQLFRLTRLRLATWYALVMGCILGLSGFGLYHVVAHAYLETINKGLQSVGTALSQSIEPIWQQPERLKQLAQEISLELCVAQARCVTKKALTQQPLTEMAEPVNYYLRLLNRSGKPIAIAGMHLEQLPITLPAEHWQTLTDKSGHSYRQINLPLYTQNQLSGYLQVGRSLNDLDQNLTFLRYALVLGWPISMTLIGWSSWWLAGLAMQPVYRSYQQMQQFTADAAHEFRTPLAAIHSTIEAAIRLSEQQTSQLLPETETTRVLQVLKRQNTRLSQLVGDLLLLARLDQQQLAINHQPCCLNDLISDLVEELAFLAIETQVILLTKVQTQKKVYVLGNEEQLYRLISNLIMNAIQATKSQGVVTVFLEDKEQYAFVKVQDTGIGIALEHQSRIFDRFYRVNNDRSRQTGGSGLGLAIAQAIVKAHKGSIQVQSQVGIGSTFTVKLPLTSDDSSRF